MDQPDKQTHIDVDKLTEAAKEKLLKYKDDDRYIIVQDEDDVIVSEKFTEDDWSKVEQMIDTHPLFSKELGNVENNELLQALQSIKYDESAETILENLYVARLLTVERRKPGNEGKAAKLPREEKIFYQEVYVDLQRRSGTNCPVFRDKSENFIEQSSVTHVDEELQEGY